MDPVKQPTITIDGTEYEVKFTQAAIIALWREHNIDLCRLSPLPLVSAENMERTAKILCVGIGWEEKREFRDLLAKLSFADMVRADRVIADALKKILSEVTAAMAEAPISLVETAPSQ